MAITFCFFNILQASCSSCVLSIKFIWAFPCLLVAVYGGLFKIFLILACIYANLG